MYKFENTEVSNEFFLSSSQICNVMFGFGEDYSKNCVVFLGQLMRLFGNPRYISKNVEEQYSYYIKATDENGDSVILEVYSGPSGPAVGGKQDSASEAAADELIEYVLQAKPVDYEYEGYYEDGPCKINQGIKNGEPYYEEKEVSYEECCENIDG